MTELIMKVLLRTDKVKYIVIPRHSGIKEGEYVIISNNMDLYNKIKKEEKDGGSKKP